MKNGTFYAKRVRRLFTQLKQEHDAPAIPEPSEPLHQLLLALLSAEATEAKAARAIKALFEAMVDVNEIRVSTSAEIAEAIRPYVPNPTKRGDAVRRALNAIFRKEHTIDLNQLNKMGLREAKQYLEGLDGVDPASVASVMLWSLGGHAIPVTLRLYETLRKAEQVDPSASVAQVQAFLERNIAANDARAFCLLMQRFVSTKGGRSHAPEAGERAKKRTAKPKTTARDRATRTSSSAAKKTSASDRKSPVSR